MYAMQYRISLPTDYDMTIIRDRVARTGHLMDGYPGLEFKAYLIQEKAQGAPGNAYAPFYVWRDTAGMRRFCWGEPGYSAIVRDFGRQPIQDWVVHGITRSPADPAGIRDARSVTIRTIPLPHEAAPSGSVPAIADPFLDQREAGTLARVAAVDVTAWNLILVEVSTDAADQATTDHAAYEVLHVSTAG